ncbi:MAG: DUF547 domain-containing protein [Candidatus Omnitrophica bacterium]|nr:DUF547 domain-containing protein [Candidatus Omnitrophota bacterium]
MRLLKTAFFAAGILIFSAGFLSNSCFAAAFHFDHASWDQFLKKYVNESGEVNYAGVKSDPVLLNQYMEQLSAAAAGSDVKKWLLDAWPREEQLAFWLNAYHAGVVLRVVQNYPLRSINDISGVWTTPTLKIGSRSFSLNDIRSIELINAFRDEKIHLALSCGARSCPPFPREAFVAARVEGQLFMIANQRVQDEKFVRIDPKKKRVFLSRIFNWYGNDFILDFGAQPGEEIKFTPPDMAVLSFVRHYTQDAEKIEFLENLRFKIKYMPFDWNLADGKDSPRKG